MYFVKCVTGTGGMWRCVVCPHTAVCQFPGESVASGNLWKRQFASLPHYISTVKPASSLEGSRAAESSESPWYVSSEMNWQTYHLLRHAHALGSKWGRRDGDKEPEWCSRLRNGLLLSLVLMGYVLTRCSHALRALCSCCHLWTLKVVWGPLLVLLKSSFFVHGGSPVLKI